MKNKMTKEEEIIDYLQKDNQKLIKKKIQRNLHELSLMNVFTTEYREQSRKQDILSDDGKSRKVHTFFDSVTPAGKSQYLPKP